MLLFAYSLLMCLLHSLWQAGILYVLYAGASGTILSKASPVSRRNLLLLIIALQLTTSISSFLLYYLQPDAGMAVLQLSAYLPATDVIFYSVSPWLIAAYFTILAIRIINIFFSWYRFRKLYKAGLQKPGAALKVFTELTAHRLGIRKKVQLWLSNAVTVPVVFGYFKPVILLPVALVTQLSVQQAEALVVHELTHIKVNDYLLNWYLSAVEIIFFFNPFVHKLCSHAKLEREKNCDTNVLYFGSNAVLYAETLLLAAKNRQEKKSWLQLAAVGNKKILLQRIRFFTGSDVFNFRNPCTSIILAPLILFAVMSIMTVLALMPRQQKSEALVNAGITGFSTVETRVYSLPAPPQFPEKKISAVTTEAASIKPVSKNTKAAVDAAIISQPDAPQLTATDMLNVAFNTNELDREVIIEEQASGSKNKSLAVYTLVFKNGQWVLKPRWLATSQKILVDTNHIVNDTLYMKMEQ